MNNMRVLSIDCETNGLYGQIFAIGAKYKDFKNGEEAIYQARVSIEDEVNSWVQENVLPHVQNIELLDKTVDDDVIGMEKLLLSDFKRFYDMIKNVAGSELKVIGHMVCPVEANLFIKMRKYGIMEEFEGPYPLYDVASMLFMIEDEDPTTVDGYIERWSFKKPLGLNPHNPLYDAKATLTVFKDLKIRMKGVRV